MLKTVAQIKTWYKWHKWLSIFTGLALLMWLLTGMVMSWGRLFPDTVAVQAKPDFTTATLSPADAIAALDQALGQPQTVRSVALRMIVGQVAYDIQTGDGAFHLVNATTGNVFAITPELAQQIAQADFPTAQVVDVERIDQNSRTYPFGPIPVYRVIFDDWRGTYDYVSIQPDPAWDAKTGDVRHTTRWSRLGEILGAMHTFWVLKIVVNNGTVITSTLWLAALVTLLAALIGYYLALPRRWQIQNAREENKKTQ